jgi:cytochrome d ubiquinol oxidase subunit II
VAVGNIVKGLPLDSAYNYTGGFFGLLNPYALLLGLVGLGAFLLQGTTYTMLKTESSLQTRAKELFARIWPVFVVLYLAASVYTYLAAPHLFANYARFPGFYAAPLLAIAGMAVAKGAVQAARYGAALVATSLIIAGMILTLAVGMYPNLVPAADPALSLTIYNASSSPLTLKAMLVIALIGMPFVLFYTIYVYRVFRGKVKADQEGY